MTETVEDIFNSILKVIDDYGQAHKILEQILEDNGGLQVYLPLKSRAVKEELDQAIYEVFEGNNIKEVCKRFNVSFNRVYDAIRREKKRRAEVMTKKLDRELPFQ